MANLWHCTLHGFALRLVRLAECFIAALGEALCAREVPPEEQHRREADRYRPRGRQGLRCEWQLHRHRLQLLAAPRPGWLPRRAGGAPDVPGCRREPCCRERRGGGSPHAVRPDGCGGEELDPLHARGRALLRVFAGASHCACRGRRRILRAEVLHRIRAPQEFAAGEPRGRGPRLGSGSVDRRPRGHAEFAAAALLSHDAHVQQDFEHVRTLRLQV
mmetsp:Transcript_146441/g.365199  ORF Transcript_146441/g.365199 Transcript_146441/m.365199 type:complete len:217 (-) Transcript_146441:260-910(-)